MNDFLMVKRTIFLENITWSVIVNKRPKLKRSVAKSAQVLRWQRCCSGLSAGLALQGFKSWMRTEFVLSSYPGFEWFSLTFSTFSFVGLFLQSNGFSKGTTGKYFQEGKPALNYPHHVREKGGAGDKNGQTNWGFHLEGQCLEPFNRIFGYFYMPNGYFK